MFPDSSRARARARASVSSSCATSSAARRCLHVLDCATLEPGRDPHQRPRRDPRRARRVPGSRGPVAAARAPAAHRAQQDRRSRGRELADFVTPELEARGYRVFEISAVSRAGLRELSFALAALVEADRATKELEPRQGAHRHSSPRRQREGIRRQGRGRHVRQRLPRDRCEARALGRADRLHQRRGRGLPRRPPRQARRRRRACSRRARFPARPS